VKTPSWVILHTRFICIEKFELSVLVLPQLFSSCSEAIPSLGENLFARLVLFAFVIDGCTLFLGKTLLTGAAKHAATAANSTA
jgi:hypothetical protein